MLHFISAENVRKPLKGILDSLIELHIAHRLTDDFLILTPDENSAQDIRDFLLEDPRLGTILTGQSILTIDRWIKKCSDELHPNTRTAPSYIHEALLKNILTTTLPASYSNLSFESFFLLLQSFRKELLKPSSLFQFLEAFDPELAKQCGICFEKYNDEIDENLYLKDFVWQINSVLESLSKRKVTHLKNIRRIYYLGFIDFPPLLKKTLQAIEQCYPEIEQLVLCQKPSCLSNQDYFSKHWGEVPSQLHEFQESQNTNSITCTAYAGAFNETSDVIKKITQLVKQNVEASSIALFLPADDFLKSHFEQQLFRIGLFPVPQKRKKLIQFAILKDSFQLTPQEALEYTNRARETSLSPEEMRAIDSWADILEEILFYEEVYPDLKNYFPSLEHIAQKQFIETSRTFHEGIQIRSSTQAGLKSFSHSFIPQSTDDVIPQRAEHFFAFALPDFEKQISYQRHLFQHLICSGNENQISYAKIGFQGQEKSPSSFINPFPIKEHESSQLNWIETNLEETLPERLQIEIKRENDLTYQYSHGAYIQNKEILEKLHQWVENKIFSPSRLEKYATCPFSFYANSLLGIEMEEEKTLEGDVREQGKWVHQLLEYFFTENLSLLKKAGRDLTLRNEVFEKLKSTTQNFTKIFLKEKQWVHSHLFEDFSQRVVEASQEIIILFWKQWEDPKAESFFIPRFFEKEFGKEIPFAFHHPRLAQLRLKGRIDRIDVSEDGKQFITWDYKTGSLQNFTSEVLKFKKLQIPIYLLAAQKMKELEAIEPIASLALGLQDITYNQGLAQKDKSKSLRINGRSSSLLDENKWEIFWKEFEKNILDYFEKIYQGDFRPIPDPCSEFCEYRNICRYHERKKA